MALHEGTERDLQVEIKGVWGDAKTRMNRGLIMVTRRPFSNVSFWERPKREEQKRSYLWS